VIKSKLFDIRTIYSTCLFCSLLVPLHLSSSEENRSNFPWQKAVPESTHDLSAIQAQIQLQLASVRKTVVSVVSEDGTGSGIVVSEDGLILTAAHVIGKSDQTMKVIFEDGSEVDGLSLGGSEISDAGILKIIDDRKWEYTRMAMSHASKEGDWCFALGHPNGFDKDRGLVLRVGRILEKKEETLRTDCRLLGGDSGGPLLSMDGKVIGIHSRISQNSDDNFHTSIESFHSNWEYFLNENLHTLASLEEGGFLGILCEETADGLLILEVIKDSPAQRHGLCPGDLLKQFNGVDLDTKEKLTILVSSQVPGSRVIFDYLREGWEISVQITLGKRSVEQ